MNPHNLPLASITYIFPNYQKNIFTRAFILDYLIFIQWIHPIQSVKCNSIKIGVFERIHIK